MVSKTNINSIEYLTGGANHTAVYVRSKVFEIPSGDPRGSRVSQYLRPECYLPNNF